MQAVWLKSVPLHCLSVMLFVRMYVCIYTFIYLMRVLSAVYTVGEENFPSTLIQSLAGLIIKSTQDRLIGEKQIFNSVHTGYS